MSDATERPPEPPATDVPVTEIDPDAWERACEEDLAAERARQRARQTTEEPGSVAEEFLKLADALAEKVAQTPIAGAAVQGAVQQLIAQAKANVEPVIERNPEVFEHLASAGSELLAAYRAAVTGQERRWTQGAEGDSKGGGEESESSSSEHIDLD
ncbi:DUF5304 family protein [Streptomyces rapamycinicus]|uniref:DUF5304 domain-containing protein n=2 Tax=Streptomyces rapamycinicus TaxID=1226757 RepID=A0A0A0NMW6_STRRN|nr:DUF5304 family protein [Streptomyces rapamycinicus]AGP58546.1 hypothetical protein M271_35705 [Streptomyces rapamycinicus NRRL 5491]MBB4786256.1 hypothetical protein [Streptomyces rapamycinicus]RLV78283.1 hypothetical protein D3C57_107900 [Streptomyces rapamycinicus NRRL 5491]UTO66360.1 DUF5304 domain-containing protein [Streptomyces rapamycinicus]UTP34314.1 DUF5304 domain-containing protein [Streptomyces rapamycinicus NRRL 5491]